MRELKIEEFTVVSGGSATKVVQASPVGRAFTAGYAVGNLINKYTPVQSWLSDGLDYMLGGTDY